jgi:hypothetical protein
MGSAGFGAFHYQTTQKVEVGYRASQPTITRIDYSVCVCPEW